MTAAAPPATAGHGRSLPAIVDRLADLLFPRRCAGCRRFGAFFCAGCRDLLIPAPDTTLAEGSITVHSAYLFAEPLRRAIHALKYAGHYRVADPLGELLAQFALAEGISADLIVPVPLHPARQRQRGFNQAERLSRPLAAATRVPVVAGLRRAKSTKPQARLATIAERRINVQDAYAPGSVVVTGRRVLLIDDVTTTGSTLTAAGAVLLSAGAAAVTGLTLARAPFR